MDGVETGAETIIAVASESLVIVPIELVAVISTRMYLSTSVSYTHLTLPTSDLV